MVLRSTVRLIFFISLVFAFLYTPTILAQGPDAHVSWHPDGEMLAIGIDTTVYIVDGVTLQPLNTISGLMLQVCAPSWSSDGTRLAVGNGANIEIWQEPWDANTAQHIATIHSSFYFVDSIGWNPQNEEIALASGKIELWRIPEEVFVFQGVGHEDGITQLSWRVDGTQFVTSSFDDTVRIWDASNGDLVSTLEVWTNTDTMMSSEWRPNVLTVNWNPVNANQIAYGSGDGTVRVWDRTLLPNSTERMLWGMKDTFYLHDGAVWSVVWDPTGTKIASSGGDGYVSIWNMLTETQEQLINLGEVVSLDWSSNGQLVYGYPDGSIGVVLPPTADAGPDQTLPDADSSSTESVTLDGSGSTDPDGTIVTYSWTDESGTEIATGPTPTIELPVDVHTLTLTVTDDDGLTASDEVVITITSATGCTPPNPPLVGDYIKVKTLCDAHR